MAISGGSYKVTNDKQQSFVTTMNERNSTINSQLGVHNSVKQIIKDQLFDFGRKNIYETVGVTPEMLAKITGAIDSYISNLTGKLDQMPTAIDYKQGFRGLQVESKVQDFVVAVKDVCKNYLMSLQEAENQIIESVYKNYEASDEDLSSQLGADTSAIQGQ